MAVEVLLLLLVLVCTPLSATVTITVDPLGGDDGSCMSIGQLSQAGLTNSSVPCETLNYALSLPDNETNDYYSTKNCTQATNGFTDVLVLLKEGLHSLTSQLKVLGYSNITIESDVPGGATIECVDFPNYRESNFDNIFACGVTGLQFIGVNFERCGPISSNVFIYNSTDVVFDTCTFR